MTRRCASCAHFDREYSDSGYLSRGECTIVMPPWLHRSYQGVRTQKVDAFEGCEFHRPEEKGEGDE